MAPPRLGLTSSEMIAALAACGMTAAEARRRRRRQRLRRAIHELRRPLQALLLAPETTDKGLTATDLALAALQDLESVLDLDRERRADQALSKTLSWQRLLDDAAERWRQAAWLRGGKITACCEITVPEQLPGEVAILLARALDNLIINALTHGGATVRVAAEPGEAAVRLSVTDQGFPPTPRPPTRPGRHGHGLQVVSGIAIRLGGDFNLTRTAGGSRAELRLPQPWRQL